MASFFAPKNGGATPSDALAIARRVDSRGVTSNACPGKSTSPARDARHGVLLYKLRWAGPDGHKQLGTKERHGIKKIPGKKIQGNGGNKFQVGKNRNGTGKKLPYITNVLIAILLLYYFYPFDICTIIY